MPSDPGIIIHAGFGNSYGPPVKIKMIHHEGVTFVKVDGSGMGFAKGPMIINFTDELVRSSLNNLKTIAATPQIDIPMGCFATCVNFLAVGAF